MTQYAKEVENKLQYPEQSEFPGVPNWQTHEPLLRSHGYLPLVGEPEPPEGYSATPATWHIEHKTGRRTEPRPYTVEDWETDPETGERRKTGEHTEWRDTEIEYDTSYIQVDKWDYEPVPVPPPPEPEPVIYSKLKIVKAMLQYGIWGDFWAALTPEQQTLWGNAVNFNSQYLEFAQGLAAFKQAFPNIDADAMLEQCVAE